MKIICNRKCLPFREKNFQEKYVVDKACPLRLLSYRQRQGNKPYPICFRCPAVMACLCRYRHKMIWLRSKHSPPAPDRGLWTSLCADHDSFLCRKTECPYTQALCFNHQKSEICRQEHPALRQCRTAYPMRLPFGYSVLLHAR